MMMTRKCHNTLDLVTIADHYHLNGRRPGDADNRKHEIEEAAAYLDDLAARLAATGNYADAGNCTVYAKRIRAVA
jgi:hypothetical protein